MKNSENFFQNFGMCVEYSHSAEWNEISVEIKFTVDQTDINIFTETVKVWNNLTLEDKYRETSQTKKKNPSECPWPS